MGKHKGVVVMSARARPRLADERKFQPGRWYGQIDGLCRTDHEATMGSLIYFFFFFLFQICPLFLFPFIDGRGGARGRDGEGEEPVYCMTWVAR